MHIFAAFVTPYGTAANNRGETEGNVTTLQKLVWQGKTHSTVSAESIRFALRRRLAEFEATNRGFDESTRSNLWADPEFLRWASEGEVFIDDDVLGFMSAKAAKGDETGPDSTDIDEPSADGSAEETEDKGKKAKGKKKPKVNGTAKVRRGRLEVTRAVSLTPWAGDVTFNAASPGATPSAAKKGAANPVPYGTEMHATRYQYAIAITPDALRRKERAKIALESLCTLGAVAGNHGRFLFDFSPEAVVFRVTHEPSPRILNCFVAEADGQRVSVPTLIHQLESGDLKGDEIYVGGLQDTTLAARLQALGVHVFAGVRAALAAVTQRMGA